MSTFVPKWKTVLTTVGQFIAIMTVIGPASLWLWHATASATDAKARAYIHLIVDDKFDELTKKIDQLATAINRGQAAQSNQSEEAAKLGRQILCLQKIQADPASGTVESCMALQ